MPIPAFTIDGVLPPFAGPEPGGPPENLSPYLANVLEVVTQFATSANRRAILRNWIAHRAALRGIGFAEGFQWLDGSFLEDKEPKDLDIVTFLVRPPAASSDADFGALLAANPGLLVRPLVKASFTLDTFFIDLDGDPASLVWLSAYYLGLFSHQRVTFAWKGMLQVDMDDPVNEPMALYLLDQLDRGAAP